MTDYDRMATVTWASQPSWLEGRDKSLEEYCDDLTLEQAVLFIIDHLGPEYRRSVIVRCGAEKYNVFDIEAMYQDLILRTKT